MIRMGHDTYRKSAGNALISKDQILLKLYAGSLNFLKLARRGMEENNPKVRGENISKVMAILTELDSALDMESGGDMAKNLSMLYRHMMYSLTEASLKNDIEVLEEVNMLLQEISDGFKEAALQQKKATAPDNRLSCQDVSQEKGFSYAV